MVASTQAQVVSVTPVLDTSAYVDGDLLFDAVEAPLAVFQAGRAARLESVSGFCKTDASFGFDLLIFQDEVDGGAAGAAPTWTDAIIDAGALLGRVTISTSDFTDLGPAREFTKLLDPGLMLQAASGTRSLWLVGINRGSTPTFGAADDLDLKLGLRWF